MRILLLTPPLTQLNTPYPATAYLTGFLRGLPDHGLGELVVEQADLGIELVLALFSRRGLELVAAELEERYGAPDQARRKAPVPAAVRSFLAQKARYLATVESVVRFLQGKDPTMALRLTSDADASFLPRGPRFHAALAPFLGDGPGSDPLAWAFGALGAQDRAKHLASLYIDDLADVLKTGIDPRFELSRYGERLAASAPSFDPMAEALAAPPSLVDRLLDELAAAKLAAARPDVIGLTAPFPGNVYGALRLARVARAQRPDAKIVLGGGYVNTELRTLNEPRLFDYVDFVTLDDGERPFLCILEHLEGRRGADELLRTFVRDAGRVVLRSGARAHDIPLRDAGTPTYDGLPLGSYLSVVEMLNPMHRLWSDGRWNKLTLAHGCYWRKCNFCDIGLDYIGRYEEQAAERIAEKMSALAAETGQTGFHFVDEAAPPKVLLALADRLILSEKTMSWWGNVRFERTFAMPGVAAKLKRAGCVAVSGGLEVASDRLLKLMNKGVTVEQVARVTHALAEAGILVHAYLMYGFPTQTVQETVDALERVRQLFAHGCLHSAFWHRFVATVHSPIGKEPERFGITLVPSRPVTFAANDLDFVDPTGVDHDALGVGLRRAVYNFMHGIGLDEDVRFWFGDLRVPKARVPKRLVAQALRAPGRQAGGAAAGGRGRGR